MPIADRFCLVQAAAQPSSGPQLELCGVADIKPGDKVLAFNHETGRSEPRRVLHTMHSTSDHLRILTTTAVDGTVQEFQTTNEHPFWVVGRDDYVEAKELRPGDKFRTRHGELVTVTASAYEPHPEGIAVYNFEVEGLHNYFVKRHGSRGPPVLAHNATCAEHARQLRANLDAAGRAPLADEAAAHIVASGHLRHAEAREILNRAGIGIDDAINGGGLPRNTKVPNPFGKTTHNVTHRHAKMDKVTEMLRQAEIDGTVKETLRAIERLRQSGTF